MAKMFMLPNFTDKSGKLVVEDKALGFEVKRVFWIHDVKGLRGGHRHHETQQALVCVSGKCEVFVNNGKDRGTFILDSPNKCLILDPCDWHTMNKFSKGAVLLVMASTHYDKKDYVVDAYD